uniref:Acyl-CoA synthetase short-chain family member 3, mitochondrial n=1 Tax=Plectus sambesii TaxID=2011161 RepID=A0A914XD93_9BILA
MHSSLRRFNFRLAISQPRAVIRRLASSSAEKGTYLPPTSYEEDYRWSLSDPESFWAAQANQLDWHKKWNKVLDNSHQPFTKWFVGGELNVCYNALDRHVYDGRGDRVALIYDSPVTGTKKKYTYEELLDEVQSFAGVLKRHGVKKGDRVLLYMPMIPEAIVAMLASARLGAVHIVVFGGFASKELAVRINHSEPRVIVTASAGVEPTRVIDYKPILDQAIELSDSKPQNVIIYQRPGYGKVKFQSGRDLDWDSEMAKSSGNVDPVPVEAHHPLYILHTSGTTGQPKGVVRPSGGYAVVLPWSMYRVYGIKPGETWWASSDLGWVVGHSYICYGPLLAGLTSVLYEGKPVGTPDAGQFFRLVSEHNVSMFFTAPTALRAIRQYDPDCVEGNKYEMKNLRVIHSAGEHLDYETRLWAQKEHTFNVPVLDHWWQTESGWPICAPCLGYQDANWNPPKDTSGLPVPGWNVQVLNDKGGQTESGELGRIVIKLPLPPGALSTFWQSDERFANTYFQQYQGYYDTMDAGARLEDGEISVMSRVDDVINVAGHRISGGALEEALLEHHVVVDCAIIGVPDSLKGHVPVAICVLRNDFTGDTKQVSAELIKLVREHVGAVAVLKKIIFVPKLPKTRSGKIARNTLSAMADSKPFQIPVTIEDSSVFPVILEEMKKAGLALKAELPK